MAQVICEYCGALNDDQSAGCSRCGAPLPIAPPAAAQPSPPPPPHQSPAPSAPPPYPLRSGTAAAKPRGPAAGCAIVGCVVLAVFFMLFMVGMFSAVKSVDTSKRPVSKTPAPASAAHAVLSLHGSAGMMSPAFDVSREWDLVWSYNCANLGRPGAFAMKIHLIGAPKFLETSLERNGPSGTGRQHVATGGTYRVSVATRCRWGIKALDHG